ncbi:MAG: hypothetical protein HDT39_15600 [Lachnospiraceae bacterium]|nr:hypothetical protein [Lachnospiraceae bacterium]
MRKQSILATITSLGLAVSMSLSVQAANINDINVQIKNKNCVVVTGQVNDLLEVNNLIEDIRNEMYNGSLGNCQIITFPNCNKPETNEPETSNPETNKPETNQPETSKPGTNQPETNEPETSKPETNKPGVNQPETNQPETSKPETDKEDKSFAEQVADLVNAERAKAGLSPLTLDKEISSAALIRTKEIEKSFSHTRPDGRKFTTVLTDNGIKFRGAGENIAWGYVSPEKVMEAWMNSEGHRANILDPDYKKIGVGYNKNSAGTSYWTQLFTY